MKLTVAVLAFILSEYLYQEGARVVSFVLLIAVIIDLSAPWVHALRIRRRLKQYARRVADGFTQEDMSRMQPGFKRMWHGWEYGSDDPRDTLYRETARALGVELSADEAKLLMSMLNNPFQKPHPQ